MINEDRNERKPVKVEALVRRFIFVVMVIGLVWVFVVSLWGHWPVLLIAAIAAIIRVGFFTWRKNL